MAHIRRGEERANVSAAGVAVTYLPRMQGEQAGADKFRTQLHGRLLTGLRNLALLEDAKRR